jgi:exosome complex component RRP42
MSVMETSNITKETLNKMFLENKRFDGRGIEDFRELKIEYDVSNKAEGSARVLLGNTEVVVGVKMQLGEPYPDSQNKGNLMVSGDLLPLASPRYESGPPGFNAIELPRLVDRAVRESGMIDFEKLCITKGEKVWTVIIDIYPINDDGNVIDAASIGAVAALRKANLPALDSNGNIDYKKESTTKLPLSDDIAPISFSFFKLGDSIILDPTREEEEASDTRITFGLSLWEKQHMCNSCQKKGETALSQNDIEKMMDILPKKFDELSEKLKTYIN